MPSTAATSALPITANWTSCSGVQLTLAPRSSTVVDARRASAAAPRSPDGRCRAASSARSARSPSARRCCRRETQACATSSLTRLIATRIDESFFLRSASAGGSCIATTSLAGVQRQRDRAPASVEPARAPPRAASSSPTSDHPRVRRSSRNRSAAGTRDRGTVVAPHRVDGYRDGIARSAGSGVAARGRTGLARRVAGAPTRRPWS